jgi:hypothetical protein
VVVKLSIPGPCAPAAANNAWLSIDSLPTVCQRRVCCILQVTLLTAGQSGCTRELALPCPVTTIEEQVGVPKQDSCTDSAAGSCSQQLPESHEHTLEPKQRQQMHVYGAVCVLSLT